MDELKYNNPSDEIHTEEMRRRKNHTGTLISKGKGKPYLMKVVYNGDPV